MKGSEQVWNQIRKFICTTKVQSEIDAGVAEEEEEEEDEEEKDDYDEELEKFEHKVSQRFSYYYYNMATDVRGRRDAVLYKCWMLWKTWF